MEGNQKHCAVPLSPTIALDGLDELLDLTLGQMLSRPKLGIGTPNRRLSVSLLLARPV
jgi:hypothetical protein